MVENEFYCADWEELIPLLPDNNIQLVLTSPPYEDLVNYDEAENLHGDSYVDKYFTRFLSVLRPKIKNTGFVVIVVNDKKKDWRKSPVIHQGICKAYENDWFLVDTVAWLKTQGIPRKPNELQDWWEYILIFAKDTAYKDKYHPERIRGVYSASSVQRYGFGVEMGAIRTMASRALSSGVESNSVSGKTKVVKTSDEGKLLPNVLVVPPDSSRKIEHPGRFPIKLAEWGVILMTDKGDLVYDPMCGSGTTCIAAKILGRRWLGSDISSNYVEVSEKEISKYYEQTTFIEEDFTMEL